MKDGGTVTYSQDGNIHVNESKVEEKRHTIILMIRLLCLRDVSDV